MIKTMTNLERARAEVLRHPVKLTALLYLREALRDQQYEICAEVISMAKEFGATPAEIQRLLEDPRRSPG